MEKSIFVSREDLYDQVWTTPTQRLAQNYGISDVALAKICKKLCVPKPPKGYWAKVAAGYKPKKSSLPAPRPSQQGGVTITPSLDIYRKLVLDSSTVEVLEKVREREITVPQVLEHPHPLIRRARKHLRTRKPDKYGMIWSIEESLNIRISKANLIRGLTLLNTIFRELELVGFQIDISKGPTTILGSDGTETTIALNERAARSENPPRKKDDSWWLYEKYSFEPSGELEIVLGRWPIGESRWKDTRVRTLESRIKDILAGIIKSMEMVKKEDDRRAKEEEIRQQLELEREEFRRIAAHERQRKNVFEDQSANWHRAKQMREFIAVAEAAFADEIRLEKCEITAWAEWARKYANEIDPLTNGEILQAINGEGLQPFG